MNKKLLYEKIMANVAKTVKKAINESSVSDIFDETLEDKLEGERYDKMTQYEDAIKNHLRTYKPTSNDIARAEQFIKTLIKTLDGRDKQLLRSVENFSNVKEFDFPIVINVIDDPETCLVLSSLQGSTDFVQLDLIAPIRLLNNKTYFNNFIKQVSLIDTPLFKNLYSVYEDDNKAISVGVNWTVDKSLKFHHSEKRDILKIFNEKAQQFSFIDIDDVEDEYFVWINFKSVDDLFKKLIRVAKLYVSSFNEYAERQRRLSDIFNTL